MRCSQCGQKECCGSDQESELTKLRKRVEELEARKCSHGDYRMQGTTDCKNEYRCGGRVSYYVIGEGLCVSCENESAKIACDDKDAFARDSEASGV